MAASDFKSIVAAANARLGNNRRHRNIGPTPNGAPRFELYHSAPSLCSHKVRTVLTEKGVSWRSHDMNIMPAGKTIPENYRPSYVRMRMLGAPESPLASGYTGQSAVSSEGFDPCVVPTLVDHEKERVIIDSSQICAYIDREAGTGPALIPEHLVDAVNAQIELVDHAPHPGVLYGANPAGDSRPRGLQLGITGVQAKKIRTLNAMIAELDPDDPIISAYKAKIAKESGSAKFVSDPECMRSAYQAMDDHAGALEAQLNTHNYPWVVGDEYTMADICWTVSLFRLKWLGLAHTWEANEARPRVTEYLERAFQRPSFLYAVVNWPFAYGPSQHVDELNGFGTTLRFMATLLARRNWVEYYFG